MGQWVGWRRWTIPIACLYLLAAAGTPAGAAVKGGIGDPDDSAGVLDMSSVNTFQGAPRSETDQRLRVFRVAMWESWVPTSLYGGNSIDVHIDTDGEVGEDRLITIRQLSDGSLGGAIVASRTDVIVGFAQVTKVGSKAVRLEFPKRVFRRHANRLRFFVSTDYTEPTDPDCGTVGSNVTVCVDRAPDRGWSPWSSL